MTLGPVPKPSIARREFAAGTDDIGQNHSVRRCGSLTVIAVRAGINVGIGPAINIGRGYARPTATGATAAGGNPTGATATIARCHNRIGRRRKQKNTY